MLSGLTGWHLIILFGVFLIFIPLLGIIVTVNSRKRKVASGEVVVGQSTNTLSIVAFVLSFFAAVPAVICGHISLIQLRRSHERGWGFAVASLWIGYYAIGLTTLAILIGTVAYFMANR